MEQTTPNSSLLTAQPNTQLILTVLSAFLTIVFPFLLVMFNVRVVMTPAFLTFEYARPGFPEDFYGFTRNDRLDYAPYAIDYLLNGEDITFLGDLRFPDGTSLFNARELQHMRDVKVMTQFAYWAAIVISVMALGAAYILKRNNRLTLALFRGGLLTLGIVATIIFMAVFNWDFFFTGFHKLFFESGTWYFAYSDTLIRLFPEQFWFDAALLIGISTTAVASLTLLATWYVFRQANK